MALFEENKINPHSETPYEKYYLNVKGVFFRYGADRYNQDTTRARLYDSITKEEVYSVRVDNRSHQDIINILEIFALKREYRETA